MVERESLANNRRKVQPIGYNSLMMRWCLIGLGPVGSRLVENLSAHGAHVTGFDPVVRHPKILNAESVAAAVPGCELVIAAVPSSAAGTVVNQAKEKIAPNALFLDWSSSSGANKREYAKNFPGYVDVTLLDPIEAERPLVAVSGERSSETVTAIEELGFEVWNLGQDVGTAADAKMLRSLFMKPFEALWVWWYAVAADNPGRAAALRSIDRSISAGTISEFSTQMLLTNVKHAKRRAEELSLASGLVPTGLDGNLLSAAQEALSSLATLWQSVAAADADPVEVARMVAGLAKGTI